MTCFKILAIKKVFPTSKHFLCAWHIQQGFKKKICFLNKGNVSDKKELYQRIIQLPFSEYEEDFDENFKEIIESEQKKIEHKSYLQKKAKEKKNWAKCFMKNYFCCGMCTSSRIESKHRLYKRFLKSSTHLIEFFKVLRELEEIEIFQFKDEVTKLKKQEA